MSYEYKKDCKSFPSVFTCDIMKSEGQKDCKDCLFYEKIDKKILIIKLGAIGDVIRTTPIVDALRKKHGYNSQITWIVDNSAKDFIKDKVDRAWSYTPDIGYRLMFEKFDVVYSLEVDTPTTFLANLAKAKEKYGFYLSDQGHPEVFNEKARYYLDRALSDHANKNNRKTYVQMIFDICELPYENNTYTLTNYKKGYGLELKNKRKLICLPPLSTSPLFLPTTTTPNPPLTSPAPPFPSSPVVNIPPATSTASWFKLTTFPVS